MEEAVCGPRASVVTLLPPVLFDHDQSSLTPAGEVALHDVLTHLLAAPEGARIVIEGHADVTGTDDYNELLAFERAQTVIAWLVAHGLPSERLDAIGQGERMPLVAGETHEALAPNRRVTIRIEEPSR